MSGLSVLYGAYPLIEDDAPDVLKWQPIPIHVISDDVDNVSS